VNFTVPKIPMVGVGRDYIKLDKIGQACCRGLPAEPNNACASIQKTIFPIKYAMTTDDTVATIPGTMKL
jgi:hypothetical protein